MKMSKRIFIVLLTLAVMISSFALFASASEAEPITIDNYEYVLEYYEEPVIFGCDLAVGENGYADYLLMNKPAKVTHSVIADENAPDGKYLEAVIASGRPNGDTGFYFSWSNEEGVDDLYFDTTVSAGAASGKKCPIYRLVLGNEVLADLSSATNAGVAVLTLDFANGTVSYYAGVDENGETVENVAEYTLSADSWYNVSLDYSVTDASCTVSLTNAADAADTVTVSDVALPYDLVKNVIFGVHKSESIGGTHFSNGNIIKIASISAAGGSHRRNTADTQKGIEDALLAIYGIYTADDIAIENKIGICEVVNALLGYGFETADAVVQAAIDDIKYGSVTLYSDALAAALETLGALDNYYDKRQCVDDNLEYADVLSEMDLSPVGPEAAEVIKQDIAALYAADEALKQAEIDSLEYIALLSGAEEDSKSSDYNLLLSYYDAASLISPDLTYEGVEAVHGYYLAIVDRMNDIALEAEYFISMVEKLSDTERDFMLRYDDYLDMKDNVYENETYPGVTEALALYNDVVLPDILYNIGLAEGFITYIERANFATYISAKEENIKIADEYLELCHPNFEGVAEAKALRLEVLSYIEVQKTNAKAYIDAVNALDSLTGDALTEGIKNAERLQKTGNVLGVEGVTEANIKLNQLVSDINLRTKYSEYFISVVDSLNFVYKAEDVYNTLVEAKAAERLADQSYPGVADASLDLEFAIENYNDSISLHNEEFVTASLAAANTAGIGETANTVADHVIAIIQTFFDEEEADEDEEKSE